MSNYGFHIKKLIISGYEKEDVSLEFKKGLNVIAGASDTGKTYIFELLNYMMGASDIPKEIVEAKGYDEVFIEIEDYKNNIFTIKRHLHDKNSIFLYKCSYELRNNNTAIKLENKHNANKDNNISKFLLGLCDLNYSKVLVNKEGKSQNISFRNIINFIMLNEEQVISKKPILEGFEGYGGKTKHKNLFKTLITGVEDKCNENSEEKKISKITIDTKIEMLDKLITRYKDDLLELEKHDISCNYNEIESTIKSIKDNINEKKEKINTMEKDLETFLVKKIDIKSKIEYNLIVIKRFKLLKQNYLSDLDRLEFIEDANFYINQLEVVHCPTCNANIEDESIIDNEELIIAINSEVDKLKKQIKELELTIESIENKNIRLNDEYKDIEDKVKKLDKEIENEIKPIIELKMESLQELLATRSMIHNKEYISKQLIIIKDDREKLIEERDGILEIQVNKYEINETNLDDICSEVAKILIECKLYENVNVEFDMKSFDLMINKKKKGSFGKGYRSIINSALILAIMNYTTSRSLPHTKLVIIDSPLTSYRGKDSAEDSEDNISEDVKQGFYKYLSESFKDKQVIILDNVKPQEEIIKNIKYYYFSKNKNKGRYGLYHV
ncbi:AAA family ATPase [Paraclostridium bifermentans]|uniref:AAA family ATPase n=1 Tax=Paraclostridium bifermentans TaxID=1490 RepID=UPI0018A8919A|nr:AAA family ATPase [Paraclostridium bifermentans]